MAARRRARHPLPDETLESHQPHAPRAQGPARHADRRRLPLGQRRAPPRRSTSTPTCGRRAHRSRRPLRGRRHRAGAREHRGLYAGVEHYIRSATIRRRPPSRSRSSRAWARSASSATRSSTRVRHGRKKVTLVHKANILKYSPGCSSRPVREVAQANTPEDRVRRARSSTPARCSSCSTRSKFDVIVTTNLFGDILSDLIAGLVGGLGLAPGREHRHATRRSSRRCTARRPTSRARASRIPARCCSRPR